MKEAALFNVLLNNTTNLIPYFQVPVPRYRPYMLMNVMLDVSRTSITVNTTISHARFT